MDKPLKELETRVNRVYRGGLMIDRFLSKPDPHDSFLPEDWISSFGEAKNKTYIPNEGITRVECDGEVKLIGECVTADDFGEGRDDSGVLIKLLDSAERLGIQVHPTKEYALKYLGVPYGKTECWHILDTRDDDACVYVGFKEYVTKETWADLFYKQDIDGMLSAMHCFKVKKGDTILIRGSTPHAIGKGCLLLEIQEPTDYTMRVEKVSLAGEVMTPMQIHYGVGEENMLECFDYTPHTKEETYKRCFLSCREQKEETYTLSKLVSYDNTYCFALSKAEAKKYVLNEDVCVTAVVISPSGKMIYDGCETELSRGDKYFISANCRDTVFTDAVLLLCYPPKK